MAKPNCYECQYRRNVPGDAHSRCVHPAITDQPENEIAALVEALRGRYAGARAFLGITGNVIGVRNGWFLWPANFDPTWLLTCDGFQAKAPKEP